MCNDYEQHIRWIEYCRMMQALELGIPTQQTDLDLPQADHIRINDIGPVMRASGNAIELVPMRFGFPPPRPRAAPVFNFRSEGRRFDKSKRCLIPASAFFEFTGKKYPKAMHRFTLNDAPFMAIASRMGACRRDRVRLRTGRGRRTPPAATQGAPIGRGLLAQSPPLL
jgi:putative SOS response-associated peptidase YedK